MWKHTAYSLKRREGHSFSMEDKGSWGKWTYDIVMLYLGNTYKDSYLQTRIKGLGIYSQSGNQKGEIYNE